MPDAKTTEIILTPPVLDDLAARFDFDLSHPDLITQLRFAVKRFAREQIVFADESTERELHRRYKTLKTETARYKALLASPDYEDLEDDLHLAAPYMQAPDNTTNLTRIGSDISSTNSYLEQLERLLRLIETATDLGISRFKPNKGRKRKVALENLVRRLAYIWNSLLNRPFTVDYHQGSGLTEAFAFVSAIAALVDSDITQTEIVTTMRTVVKERRL